MNKKVIIIASIITGVLVLLTIGVFVFVKYANKNQGFKNSVNQVFEPKKEDSLPAIKNIGINIEPYNPATGMAGDVKFARIKSQYWEEIMFENFGHRVAGNENNPSPGLNVHPEYFLPVGTKIFAVSDGTVQDVPKIYSGDYSIMVQPNDSREWTLNYEHVMNPLVKKGDKIKAGQPVAEVSNLQMQSLDASYGKWALMIFKSGVKDGDNLSYCPYLLFDESVKAEMQAKITTFIKEWELFIGKNVYDEKKWIAPGCALEKMTEAEAKKL